MLSVAEARARILAPLVAQPSEIVGLAEAWGRVLATPVTARLRQPPVDISAMDGYAMRAVDAPAGARLRVAGEAPAGHPFDGVLGAGEAVRLFTGSVVPAGADTVLLQEDASRTGAEVIVNQACVAGRHIRRAGQDFDVGDVLLPAGLRLGARAVGLAAAANYPWVAVHRRPLVAILATGDEIAMPGERIAPGGIVSSNAHALAALVRVAGGVPMVLPVTPDDGAALQAAIGQARGTAMLVTIGGASVGDHDLVKSALAERNFTMDFWKIAMRPGKPLLSGMVDGIPVLGLPGNPVSALVCAILFLMPALAALSGECVPEPFVERATLGAPLRANDVRADYLRGTLAVGPAGGFIVTPFERQDSGMLKAFANAGALIMRAPFAAAAAEGSYVDIIRLDHLGL